MSQRTQPQRGTQGELLEVRGLKKTFGGLVAVDGLEFAVRDGEIAALIGPNGSGKTTTFNLVTGFLKPDDGTVTYNGADITSESPYDVARRGLGRTFQITQPFGRLTVFENMLVPNTSTQTYSREQEEQIWSILEELDIDHVAEHNANELSGGQQKLLELARVLMLDPELILLDEPAAGVNPALMDDIIDRIHALNGRGKSFLVVEHDMSVIDELCERIIVMDSGRKIASGTFEEIRRDAGVKEAYLG